MEMHHRIATAIGAYRKVTLFPRRKKRRLFRGAVPTGVLVLLLATAMPSYAEDPTIEFIEAPAEGSELADVLEITAEASSSTPLWAFSLAIEGDQQDYREEIPHGPWPNEDRMQDTIRAKWNTRGDPPILNGVYRLSAIATPEEGEAVTSYVEELNVNNPPQKPARPEASVDDTGVHIVTPAEQPEPDFWFYDLQRSVAGGPFHPIAQIEEDCTYRDSDAPRSTELRYQLVALRYSPIDTNGIRSVASDPTEPVVMPSDVAASPSGEERCDEDRRECNRGPRSESGWRSRTMSAAYPEEKNLCTVTASPGRSFEEEVAGSREIKDEKGAEEKPGTPGTTSTAPKAERLPAPSLPKRGNPIVPAVPALKPDTATPLPGTEPSSPGSSPADQAPAVTPTPEGEARIPTSTPEGQAATTTSTPTDDTKRSEPSAMPAERTSRSRPIWPMAGLVAGGLGVLGSALWRWRNRK